jgi:hypothetical protein
MPKAGSRKSRTPPSLRVVSGGRSETPSKATKPAGARNRTGAGTHGKRVQFDTETWQAVDLLGRDRMMTFQEIADEAFRDLLKKHGRPFDLKDALRRSAADAEGTEAGKSPKRRR